MDNEPGNAGYGPVMLPIIGLVGLLIAALIRPSLVIEAGLVDFIVITCLIAGWAAWRFGSALAATWRSYSQVVLYAIPFALLVRWVHFALFHGTLLSAQYYLVDLIVVLSVATLGYRSVRAAQMSRQYHWLYAKRGRFTWARFEDEEA